MNQVNLIRKQFFTVILFASLFFGFAQTDQRTDVDKVITLKFSGYTVETDKLIQKEFSKKDGYKTVYTCIPAGIVVFETEKTITSKEKEMISSKINSLQRSLNYEFLEGITLSQAEEKCSTKRNIEK